MIRRTNKLTKLLCNNKTHTMIKPLLYGLSIGALMSFSAFAANGDAGGINGPNTRGVSIPSTMEGRPTLDQLEHATDVCLISGDSTKGIVPFLRKLFNQIYNAPSQTVGLPSFNTRSLNCNEFTLPCSGTVNLFRLGDVLIQGVVSSNQYLRVAEFDSIRDPNDQIPFLTHDNIQISLERPEEAGLGIFLQGIDIMPHIVWGSEETICDSYDDLGECVGHTYATNAHVVRGRNNGSSVSLVNTKSGHASAVTVNTEEVAQCLESQLSQISPTHR